MPCQVVCVRRDRLRPVGTMLMDENMRWKDGMPESVHPISKRNFGRMVNPETSNGFYIITILDRDPEEMKPILEESEDDSEHVFPHRRKWRFHIENMPAGIRRTLRETGRCEVSMDQIRKHIKHQRTEEMI
jgi:hypothetical protein